MHPEQASSASREEIQETQLPLEPLTLPRKELHQSETKPQDYQLGFFRPSNPNLSIRAPQPCPPPHGEQKSTIAGKKGMGGRRDARTLTSKEMCSWRRLSQPWAVWAGPNVRHLAKNYCSVAVTVTATQYFPV